MSRRTLLAAAAAAQLPRPEELACVQNIAAAPVPERAVLVAVCGARVARLVLEPRQARDARLINAIYDTRAEDSSSRSR